MNKIGLFSLKMELMPFKMPSTKPMIFPKKGIPLNLFLKTKNKINPKMPINPKINNLEKGMVMPDWL